MTAYTRRSLLLLGAGSLTGFAGCSGLGWESDFDPPDATWRVREQKRVSEDLKEVTTDYVWKIVDFLVDEGDPVDLDPDAQQFQFEVDGVDDPFAAETFVVDGERVSQLSKPEELQAGDGVAVLTFTHALLEQGDTVTLYWYDEATGRRTAVEEHQIENRRLPANDTGRQ